MLSTPAYTESNLPGLDRYDKGKVRDVCTNSARSAGKTSLLLVSHRPHQRVRLGFAERDSRQGTHA